MLTDGDHVAPGAGQCPPGQRQGEGERRRRRGCEDHGQGEVVTGTRFDSGERRQQARLDIAEVVIAGALAGEPWVLGRVGCRLYRGIEVEQVHGLLGAADLGVVGAEGRVPEEGGREEPDDGDDQRQAAPEGREQRTVVACERDAWPAEARQP
ncbi:MAG: hypothetical protein U5Q44_08565 [Dehalococcoidia bacterium]|nr:hypothetical protein [Dehalococcoidia bacterium]